MNARKFIAANSREALKLVRAALGDEAVILSNRKVEEGVEIVAMPGAELARLAEMRSEKKIPVPSRETTPDAAARRAQQTAALRAKVIVPAVDEAAQPATALLQELKNLQTQMQQQMSLLAWSGMRQADPQRSGWLRDLVNAGFSPALARQVLEKMPSGEGMPWLRRMLAHNLHAVRAGEDVVSRGGVYALVGPTGVGKTTTTAKLAARGVVRYGAERVALVTTDSYRIGAHEQLRIYGRILGVAVHAVRDTTDLKLTLSGLKHKHLVLIDTMGLGQRDGRVDEQEAMLAAAGAARILLLNATSSGGTLEEVVRRYGQRGMVGCIPTKLDEAVTLGTVLDVAARHRLLLHYIASGQRVPEDLHEVNVDYLVHRALKELGKAAAFTLKEEEMPAFMAARGGQIAQEASHA